ncbi:MAG TPA: LCP family protein [Anaerolineaceae bacterium]|nr:LCP family protein [Anaerolineaceae bacterium]
MQRPRPYQMARSRSRKSPDRLVIILAIGFMIVLFAVGTAFVLVVRNLVIGHSQAQAKIIPTETVEATIDPQVRAAEVATKIAQQNTKPMAASGGPAAKNWDGSSRINILVMGLDARAQAYDIPRSDTMILFTLDPKTLSAGMLSIPRDLWVDIPGFSQDKINTAYFDGEANHLDGGGPALAVKTVEQFLNVSINYYAVLDFNSFTKFIDDMGGLTMKIRETITVDPLGPNNDVTLKPGTQNLSGAVVLAYARDRETAHGDFDRANRQQEVIMAIRNQVVNLNMMPTLIIKSPKIYTDIASGIRTNLSLAQVVQLALIAEQVPPERIKRELINDPEQCTISWSWNGESILLPIPNEIKRLRDQLFDTSGYASTPQVVPTITPDIAIQANTTLVPTQVPPTATPVIDPITLTKREKARLQVQNGTMYPGLADKTAAYLKKKGFNVIGTANASQLADQTTIMIYADEPGTVKYLTSIFNVSPGNIYNQSDPKAPADIVVILGSDWSQKNPLK